MKKICMALTAMSLAYCAAGMGGVTYLENHVWFDSVSVTSTNLTLVFSFRRDSVATVVQDDSYRKYQEAYKTNAWATPWRVMGDGDALVLTPDQTTRLAIRDAKRSVIFTPVSFKNQQKGFRLSEVSYHPHEWFSTNHCGYVALSDTPVQVSEDDVEMIMENEEWVKYAKPLPVPKEKVTPQTSPLSPKSATPPQAAPQPDAAEDAQPQTQPQPRILWPYALIPPCAVFLAALWVVRKKRRQGG